MLADVYRTANRNKFFTVPAGKKLSSLSSVLEQLGPDYKALALFETEMPLNANQKRVGFDSAEIIESIIERGYAAHEANVTVIIGTRDIGIVD